jgi:hypothetical protein
MHITAKQRVQKITESSTAKRAGTAKTISHAIIALVLWQNTAITNHRRSTDQRVHFVKHLHSLAVDVTLRNQYRMSVGATGQNPNSGPRHLFTMSFATATMLRRSLCSFQSRLSKVSAPFPALLLQQDNGTPTINRNNYEKNGNIDNRYMSILSKDSQKVYEQKVGYQELISLWMG